MTYLSNRYDYCDIARGIGIVLVVLGHCPLVNNYIKQGIYAFHMPLFFMIYGIIWNKRAHEEQGFINKNFVKKN